MNRQLESTPPEDVGHPVLRRTIVLVGLMGAGKTSVGKRVAAMLEVPFLDSDSEIEVAAGMAISEIFANLGEPAFRDGERKVIARLMSAAPCILATGGGAFVEAETRKVISDAAVSVWLRADLDLLWDRVRGRPGRPLLEQADPRGVLAELDRVRSPLYAEADVIVDSKRGASHETMAAEIIRAVKRYDAEAGRAPPTLEYLGS